MRSWTTFLVFGGILLALVLALSLSQYATTKNPVMRTAQDFMAAVKRQDAAAAEKYIDPSMGKVVKTGNNRIISMTFSETSSIISSAFAKQDEVSWSYIELEALGVELDMKPTILNSDGLAKAPMSFGRSAYMRKIGDEWKIFYITKGATR